MMHGRGWGSAFGGKNKVRERKGKGRKKTGQGTRDSASRAPGPQAGRENERKREKRGRTNYRMFSVRGAKSR